MHTKEEMENLARRMRGVREIVECQQRVVAFRIAEAVAAKREPRQKDVDRFRLACLDIPRSFAAESALCARVSGRKPAPFNIYSRDPDLDPVADARALLDRWINDDSDD